MEYILNNLNILGAYFGVWFVALFLWRYSIKNDDALQVARLFALGFFVVWPFTYMMVTTPLALFTLFLAWACWVAIDKVVAKRRQPA